MFSQRSQAPYCDLLKILPQIWHFSTTFPTFFQKKLLPCKQKNNNIENTRLVMKLIFGFDLGSTSIGWAVVQEKENDTEASRILKLGVRVNPLTTDEKTNFEKGKPITTNANRRLAHGMRLNLSRYKQRRKELIKSLIRFKFISPDTVSARMAQTPRLKHFACAQKPQPKKSLLKNCHVYY